MKKYIFLLMLVTSFVNGQNITIPDVVFKTRLLNANTSNTIAKNWQGDYIKIDINNDLEIDVSEALLVYELRVNRPQSSSNYINTLSGIEYFTNLRLLSCGDNSITNVNLQNLTQLVTLQMTNNQLATIDISNLTNLKELFVRNNSINSIQFLNNNAIENIWVSNNNLTTLDLTIIPSIEVVIADNNNLTNINVTGLNNLVELNCSNNSLSSLNLTNTPQLNWLFCANNLFSNINISSLQNLNGIDVSGNAITNFNIAGLTSLQYITISNTLISTFDGSTSGVMQLICENNPNLTSINVKNNFVSYSDPDLLFFVFQISNNPLLQSICLDFGEQNNLAYCNYNTSGNVQVYGGINCDVPLQVMNSENFNKNNVTLFPNPVKSELNFSFEKTVSIDKINIYNTLGQLVKQFNENQNSIQLSDLNTGYYHIEFISEEGKLTKKFIKE